MEMKRRAKPPIVSGVLQISQPHEDSIPQFRMPYEQYGLLSESDSTRLDGMPCLNLVW